MTRAQRILAHALRHLEEGELSAETPKERPLTWAELRALPEEEQRAYWNSLVGHWQAEAERALDDDFIFDLAPGRREIGR